MRPRADETSALLYADGVQFVKYLRDAVRSGAVTTSIRVWHRPRVTAGKRYRMEEGEIEVDSIDAITFDEITPDLARACGFKSVRDLLRVAKHGRGENVYLVRFHYIPPSS
jgi:hypothetical protein